MTYTAIALDRHTGDLGVAVATYSLAVGASCPFVRSGVGAVSTQAATHAPHGPAVLHALERGVDPCEALDDLAATDPHLAFRQIGVVAADGATAVHTGGRTRAWAGALTGDGWIAMGNVLAGEEVVEAMADVLGVGAELPLAERLVRALEAGRDAGGQTGADGHLAERSAVVVVHESGPVAAVDLRVDAHDDAVTELRRILGLWTQVEPYYRSRAELPDATPPQDLWMRERGLG